MAKFRYWVYEIWKHVRKTQIVRWAGVVDDCSRSFESCGAVRLEKQTSELNSNKLIYTVHVGNCMSVNTDTKTFGLIVEEADVCRVYIRGYVDEKNDTLDWTEVELQFKYCEYNVYFIHSVLTGMLPSPAKTLVKLKGVMMWLV